MILYHDTEKELFLSDYISIPALHGLGLESLQELKNNLYSVLDNTFSYHSELLAIAIDMDIRKVEMYIKMKQKKQEKGGNMA